MIERDLVLRRRFHGAQASDRVVLAWKHIRAELNVVRLRDRARSELHSGAHVILGTYDGGADRVRIEAEGDAVFEGPKRAGAAGFFPAGRRVTSDWPASELSYVAIFVDPAATAEIVGNRKLDWHTKVAAEDTFSSAALMRLGLALQRRNDDIERLLAETLANALHLHVLQRFAIGASMEGGRTHSVQHALERIHDVLPRAASLQELADSARLPRARFLADFRAQTGMSPHQYILRERTTRAAALLARSDRTLEDIARACGFAHAAHLSTAFRRRFGRAPGEWRRERNRF